MSDAAEASDRPEGRDDAPADRTAEIDELAAAEPVDTEPLERAQEAIDEGHEAAARALDQGADDEDLDFRNVESNADPEAGDNAVPRPN